MKALEPFQQSVEVLARAIVLLCVSSLFFSSSNLKYRFDFLQCSVSHPKLLRTHPLAVRTSQTTSCPLVLFLDLMLEGVVQELESHYESLSVATKFPKLEANPKELLMEFQLCVSYYAFPLLQFLPILT